MSSAPAPARESALVRFFSGAAGDLRHGLRQLAKRPGFACITLLTLALCIGANTAIFSTVYSLMLRPLPFPQPDRLVEIYNTYPKANAGRGSSNLTQYIDYRDNATSYEKVGLWSQFQGMYGEDVSAERLSGLRVTAELFDVLGIKPLIGQFFTTENHLPAADKVLVLTQSFWETHYQEDPAVLGKTVRLDGETFTIIGVAPRALEAFNAARARFVRPMSWNPTGGIGSRHGNSPNLFARMKPGVSVAQALSEAEAIERRFYDTAPPPLKDFLDRSGHKIQVGGVQFERVQPVRTKLLMLQAGVVLVLLIGCVNVANLLLARANGRQSELATRLALGASRGAIARQLMLESLLLTTLGTALGIALAAGLTYAFNLYRAQLMPDALPFTLDGQVLGVTLAVSLGSALFISIAPIVHILRADLMKLIHGSRGSSVSAGVRSISSVLIIGQVAIAAMLLSAAGLLVHSFIKALAVNPGFDPRGVVTGRMAIPLAFRSTDEAARGFQQRVVQAMQEIPGVSSAALSIGTPFRGGLPMNAFTLAEDTRPPDSPQPGSHRVIVSDDYLKTMRLTLLEGRFLQPGDAEQNKQAFVVDENFAKMYFPGRSAVGGRFSFGGRPSGDTPWPTIVGVVRAVPHRGVEYKEGAPFVYHLLNNRMNSLALFLRTERPPAEVIKLMREKLQAIDPAIALFDTGTMEESIATSHHERRSVLYLIGGFAAVALFLSALGIYGVLAYDVTQRTREIGVRGAIGATAGQIIGLVMRQGLWKTALGLVLGLGGAVFVSRYLKSMLFELSPTDPRSYIAISVLLLAVAALASYLPARRAARINPIEALRVE